MLSPQPEGWLQLDRDARILAANFHAADILANVPEGFIGLTLRQLTHDADKPALEEALSQLERDDPQRLALRLQDDFGRMVPTEAILARTADGLISVYLHDDSGRRLAAQVSSATRAVTSAMAHAGSREEAIEALLATLGESMGWSLGAYWAIGHDGTLERAVAWRDPAGAVLDAELDGTLRMPRSRTLAGKALESGEVTWTNGLRLTEYADVSRQSGLQTVVAVPMRRKGEALGVIEFFDSASRLLDEQALRALDDAAAQLAQLLGILEDRR